MCSGHSLKEPPLGFLLDVVSECLLYRLLLCPASCISVCWRVHPSCTLKCKQGCQAESTQTAGQPVSHSAHASLLRGSSMWVLALNGPNQGQDRLLAVLAALKGVRPGCFPLFMCGWHNKIKKFCNLCRLPGLFSHLLAQLSTTLPGASNFLPHLCKLAKYTCIFHGKLWRIGWIPRCRLKLFSGELCRKLNSIWLIKPAEWILPSGAVKGTRDILLRLIAKLWVFSALSGRDGCSGLPPADFMAKAPSPKL